MRTVQRWWLPVLTAGILVFALTGRFWAGEDKNDKNDKNDKMENKDLDKKIGAVVKVVINRGADMHNVYRDTAGCYRFYQGSLVTLRPLLDGHPDLQKTVDTALAEANRAGSVLQRGLILNRALHKIYNKFNPKAPAKDKKDKSDVDKGPDDKAPRDDSKKDKDKGAKDKKKDKDSGDKDAGDKDGDKDKAKDKGSKKDKDSTKDKDKDKDQGSKDKDKAKDKDQVKRDKSIPKDLLSGLNKE
jgi:hypothetical protein